MSPTANGDESGLHGEGEGDVLPDHPQRSAGVVGEPGELREVGTHPGDVNRLDGGVRPEK